MAKGGLVGAKGDVVGAQLNVGMARAGLILVAVHQGLVFDGLRSWVRQMQGWSWGGLHAGLVLGAADAGLVLLWSPCRVGLGCGTFRVGLAVNEDGRVA
eukprot:362869-Chlamydomonas_euryale.AAC.3